MILTVDLGTSATKVLLWDEAGCEAAGKAELTTVYGLEERAEQDPASWWSSVVQAAGAVRRAAPRAFGGVEAIALSAARQTFVPVAADGTPLGAGILWSDRRAGAEARVLSDALGGVRAAKRRTGVVLDAGSVAAKTAWLARHEPHRLDAARWLLAPRDVVARELTGEVSSDPTLASASGLYDENGELVPELGGPVRDKLPPIVPSDAVAGSLRLEPAQLLRLRPGIPVVAGAGDRACEVLGTGADGGRSMVSWGTTANVSVPLETRPDPLPEGLTTSRGALGGWLLEGGISAAGSLLDFVARLTGLQVGELWSRAGTVPAGAHGLVVLPWAGGARAPWWVDDARAAVVGLGFDSSPDDLARAVLEAAAWELVRCIEQIDEFSARRGASRVEAVVLAGGGAHAGAWAEVLGAVSALPALRRRSGEAASAGAAMLAWRALGMDVPIERYDPVTEEIPVDLALAERYRALRPRADAAAAAVLGSFHRGF